MVQEREDVRLERPIKEVWEQAQAILSKQFPHTFEGWIRPALLLEIANDEATIGVRNEFMRKWFVEYQRESIADAISQVLNRKISVKFAIDVSAQLDAYTPSIAAISVVEEPQANPRAIKINNEQQHGTAANRLAAANLNPKYTFESFVAGAHSRFCHSAAMAVAERPGQAYNPLFLYGGVGLGKTHIMQAIGHYIVEHSPKMTVRYISGERFTNELINSIRDDRMVEFRRKYRQVDVLLIDDIQFIQNKESTQEEFFHTFNTLKESGRHVVLTSDRPPKELSLLEERLRSRFESGLIADIQPPDLETRTAILKKKSEFENMKVSDDVIEFIAATFTTNVRELEGALIRVHAYSSLTSTPLTLSLATSVLQPAGPPKARPTITMDRIIEVVGKHYRVESSELKSSKRSQDLTLPRHIAMYLAHELIQLSFPRIGEAFGGRKHTSALYAHNRIKEAIAETPEVAQAVKQIAHKLTV